jgi:tetratricopeptide (TPR) repeat protein
VRLLVDENAEQAIELCKSGLERAREMDDQLNIWRYLLYLMVCVRQDDPYQALELNEEMYDLSVNLGVKRDQISSLNSLSFTYWTLGEYDLAVESQMMGMDIQDEYEKEFGPADWRSNNLSVLYADMGEGEESLTWALWANQRYREEGGSGNPLFDMQLARANILVGDLDEAHTCLDRARADVLKSGTEGMLGVFYDVLGQYEIATGNLHDGIYHLEQSLEIAERRPSLIAMNRALSRLIEAEIQSFVRSSGKSTQDVSGPYMTRLEEIAVKKNLPGILMQHAILKADFRVVQERYDEARAILNDALKIHDSPGVKALRKKIHARLQDMDSSRVYC